MTQTLIRLAPIEAVQVPPQPRFSEDELRAMFADSCGPLVDPFPGWPGLWHQTQSTVAAFMRATELVRMGGDGTQLAKMVDKLPRGRRIQPPGVEPVSIPRPRAAVPVEFPEWVR